MNVILKFLSTLLIVIGLIYIYLFFFINGINKLSAFNQPSYSFYEAQNMLFVFIAGVTIVVISLIAAFMAFNKKMRKQEDILENASNVDQITIKTWVQGSSLDTTIPAKNTSSESPKINVSDKNNATESDAFNLSDATEITPPDLSDATEITSLDPTDATEITSPNPANTAENLSLTGGETYEK